MGQLVGDQRHERAIAGNDRRRGEGQPRILHAAEGKRRRQHQEVVAAPPIWSEQRLGRLHHLFEVGELERRSLQRRRLRVHAAARAERLEMDVADGQRDEVRRDGLGQSKLEGPILSSDDTLRRERLGAHHGTKVSWNRDACLVGLSNARTILRRNPRAGQDRLALRVQIRTPPSRRLCRRQPLQRGCRGLRPVAHDNRVRSSGERHRQRAAEDRIGVGQRVRQRSAAAIRDTQDIEVASVQHELGRVRSPLERERRRAAQALVGEIRPQVERDMRHAGVSRPGKRVDVAGGVGRVGRWCLRHEGRGGPGPRGPALAGAGRQGDQQSPAQKAGPSEKPGGVRHCSGPLRLWRTAAGPGSAARRQSIRRRAPRARS